MRAQQYGAGQTQTELQLLRPHRQPQTDRVRPIIQDMVASIDSIVRGNPELSDALLCKHQAFKNMLVTQYARNASTGYTEFPDNQSYTVLVNVFLHALDVASQPQLDIDTAHDLRELLELARDAVGELSLHPDYNPSQLDQAHATASAMMQSVIALMP